MNETIFLIRCTCDGPLGLRAGLLKDKNGPVVFLVREEAEATARRLTGEMNHEFSRAIFSYSVVEEKAND